MCINSVRPSRLLVLSSIYCICSTHLSSLQYQLINSSNTLIQQYMIISYHISHFSTQCHSTIHQSYACMTIIIITLSLLIIISYMPWIIPARCWTVIYMCMYTIIMLFISINHSSWSAINHSAITHSRSYVIYAVLILMNHSASTSLSIALSNNHSITPISLIFVSASAHC
jgi:hypothetical protein